MIGTSGIRELRWPPFLDKRLWIGLLTCIVFIVALLAFRGNITQLIYNSFHSPTPTLHPSTPTPASPTLPPLPQGLGVVPISNKQQYVGVNDGSFPAFDVYPGRTDSVEKVQAAQALTNHDSQTATTDLENGLAQDTNDAEAKIYLENIRAVASGDYITLVVAVDFVQPFPDSWSQYALQGAYTAQKEFNDVKNQPLKLRLLIANSAGNLSYVVPVAQQIARIAQQEHIVGVLGWQTSRSSINAIPVLAAAHIPLVSQSASTDDLTNFSPYFFRVIPPNTIQAEIIAKFATAAKPMGLNTKNAVVFLDTTDIYSNNIAKKDFESDFQQDGGTILGEETFKTGSTDPKTFSGLIQDALTHHPNVDVFYFAGVSSSDATAFQKILPTTGKFANLPVIAGDGSYVADNNSYDRWYFTAYAYPDEWSIITNNSISLPPFLGDNGDYTTNFDPNHTHKPNSIYGFNRPDATAILSYDAAKTLLQAILQNVSINKSPTPENVADALPQVKFQGISGYISLSTNGNPQDKAVLILKVSKDQHFHMQCVSGGTFYPGIDQTQLSCPS